MVKAFRGIARSIRWLIGGSFVVLGVAVSFAGVLLLIGVIPPVTIGMMSSNMTWWVLIPTGVGVDALGVTILWPLR